MTEVQRNLKHRNKYGVPLLSFHSKASHENKEKRNRSCKKKDP